MYLYFLWQITSIVLRSALEPSFCIDLRVWNVVSRTDIRLDVDQNVIDLRFTLACRDFGGIKIRVFTMLIYLRLFVWQFLMDIRASRTHAYLLASFFHTYMNLTQQKLSHARGTTTELLIKLSQIIMIHNLTSPIAGHRPLSNSTFLCQAHPGYTNANNVVRPSGRRTFNNTYL